MSTEMETSAGSEITKQETVGPEKIEEMTEPLGKLNSNSEEIEKFKPGWRLLSAFTSIAIVNLACALDATIVSVALPVSLIV